MWIDGTKESTVTINKALQRPHKQRDSYKGYGKLGEHDAYTKGLSDERFLLASLECAGYNVCKSSPHQDKYEDIDAFIVGNDGIDYSVSIKAQRAARHTGNFIFELEQLHREHGWIPSWLTYSKASYFLFWDGSCAYMIDTHRVRARLIEHPVRVVKNRRDTVESQREIDHPILNARSACVPIERLLRWKCAKMIGVFEREKSNDN